MINLTDSQRQAVDSKSKLILAIACPGSGKTRTLVERINRLVQTIDPKKIIAITFTNAGADEMSKRLEAVKLGYIGTLHGFMYRLLLRSGKAIGLSDGLAILPEEQIEPLLEGVIKSLKYAGSVKELMQFRSDLNAWNSAMYAKERQVWLEYESRLLQSDTVDFDMILKFGLKLIKDPAIKSALGQEFQYLFVDEYQDSSLMDEQIYRELPTEFKFYVGDPDQAIYAFRGGNIRNILAMANVAAKPENTFVVMEENFRSNTEICQAAQKLIRRNTSRVDKATRSVKGQGGRLIVKALDLWQDESDEILNIIHAGAETYGVPYSEMAILARNNFLLKGYRDLCRRVGFPIAKKKQEYVPKDFMLLKLTVALMVNPKNLLLSERYLTQLIGAQKAADYRLQAQAKGVDLSFATKIPNLNGKPVQEALEWIYNSHIISGDSARTVSNWIEEYPDGSLTDLMEHLNEEHSGGETTEPGITISTMHGSKGKEWELVILAAFEDQIIPGTRMTTDVEEERRLAYVAMTRAKSFLFVTHCHERPTPWNPKNIHRPSRFIDEILL